MEERCPNHEKYGRAFEKKIPLPVEFPARWILAADVAAEAAVADQATRSMITTKEKRLAFPSASPLDSCGPLLVD